VVVAGNLLYPKRPVPLRCVEPISRRAKGASAIKPDLPWCARGIAAIAGRLKMAAARYTLVDPAFWVRLADTTALPKHRVFNPIR